MVCARIFPALMGLSFLLICLQFQGCVSDSVHPIPIEQNVKGNDSTIHVAHLLIDSGDLSLNGMHVVTDVYDKKGIHPSVPVEYWEGRYEGSDGVVHVLSSSIDS